jgi:radical SAM superfamily enzyme YgiQ (UPF0313 family)
MEDDMKVGLIAMSGVRVYNKELLKLGMTLPGFVDRLKTIESLPSLGLLTLAGMISDDINFEYCEVNELEIERDLRDDFDAVAISSLPARIRDAYCLADAYRALDTKVILGGLHVTAMPQEALAHADSVVIGEGEPVWPTLMADLKHDHLQPVYDSRGQRFDLSNAPMPRFDLLDPERYNRVTVQTQRGCPFKCEFCAASILLSPVYKIKPVEKVIAEIHRIKERWPRRPFIELADDNTFVNKNHSKKLLRALAKENIEWFTETDLSVAEDLELLGLMQDSGCAQVLIGFESVSRSGLDGLELKTNWKVEQLEFYKRAIERIQDHGVTVNGCFILGMDNTGPESFDEIYRFVRESGLYEVQITIQTAFPGTPLYERLKRHGRLLREDAWELCTLFDVNFHPQDMTASELESNFKALAQKLYSEEFTRDRRERFRKRLRGLRRNTRCLIGNKP